MAWTSVGFDGTINEAQWASLAGLLGNDYVAAGTSDCVVTAVPGARSVSVAAGSLYGDGILSTNSGAETVAMTTPVNGQWYVIALRRTWATNTAALVAIAGATTTTTTPTAPPTSFPTLNTNKGVITDQPIAWAWCNSANTTVVVYDIRLKAVKSLPPVVATSAERDAKFMSPTQGLQVWRDDLGAVETYFGLYNASTNPGGRDTAGWYTDDRSMGLVPIKPSTVTIATGTGSANSLGQITYTGATSVTIQNVFSSQYRNYKILVSCAGSTGCEIAIRFASGGTPNSATSYKAGGWRYATNVTDNYSGSSLNYAPLALCNSAQANNITATYDIFNPMVTGNTNFVGQSVGYGGTYATALSYAGFFLADNNFDGIYLYPTAGNFTGTVQIFGYND